MDPDVAYLKSEIARLRNEIRVRPIHYTRGGSSTPTSYKTIVIDVGNGTEIGNSLEGILYDPLPLTLTAAYDPNVDTVYPEGLGRGILFVDGVQQAGYVLVRHNWRGYPYPVVSGDLVRVSGTTTLTYDPGGGGPVVTMTAYVFDFV